jgi:hypothetical protein
MRRVIDMEGIADERSHLLSEDEPDDKYKFRKPRFDGLLKWWS